MSGAYIPQANHIIITGTGEGLAVWCKRHRMDPARRSFEDGFELSGVYIPQANHIIIADTGEGLAVWCKYHEMDLILMSFDGIFELSGVYIPQPNRLVLAGTGEGFAVRCKRHRMDPARMPREQGDFGVGMRIVEPDIEVTGHRQLRTIGRIGDRFVTSTCASVFYTYASFP